ncbi:MAG: hypothetical protein R2771_06005 [Saprospiraceae bacterium]
MVENQIIIKTGNGMVLASWLQDYKKYGVRLLKKIDEGNDLWLIRYDTSKIKPADMMELMKNDRYIVEAEFNTKIMER